MNELALRLNVSARPDGSVEAAYMRLSTLQVARTREVVPGCLLADYSKGGALVGIEILGPVKVASLRNLISKSRREKILNFVKNALPQALVQA
jgi:hypothetical protein